MATIIEQEEASLFLMQATLGANYNLIQTVADYALGAGGIEGWLDNQLTHTVNDPNDTYHNRVKNIYKDFQAQAIDTHTFNTISNGNATLPYNFYWRMGWWHRTLAKDNSNALTNTYNAKIRDGVTPNTIVHTYTKATLEEQNSENIVRHRIAQALSEILVISDKSVLELDALGMADYYDILYKNAFGNYSTMLKEVSLHPMMGVYLTHLNNKKTNGTQHPDENYAREIMQLFTIGLNELDNSGDEVLDANSNPIPTYNNDDIKQLSRVFTGLKGDSYEYEYASVIAGFTNGSQIDLDTVTNKTHITIPFIDMETPMKEQASQHDQTIKQLFNHSGKTYTVTIPGGNNLDTDITNAINGLMNHPNTKFFVSKKLIQQLTTSNPSSGYVQRVATAFGNTGDMKATIKAILMDSEARDTNAKKLKSPLLRTTQLLRAFNTHNTSGKLWFRGDMVDTKLQNHVLSSPTVFNFYLPNYAPHGDIETQNKVAPEFQLHNSSTSIAYANMMYEVLFGGNGTNETLLNLTVSTAIHTADHFRTSDTTLANDKLKFNFTDEKVIATAIKNANTANNIVLRDSKIDELISRLCLTLTAKNQSDSVNEIKSTIADVGYDNEDWLIQTIVFLIVTSPQYTVQRKR